MKMIEDYYTENRKNLVKSLVYRAGGSVENAEDIVQMAFLKAIIFFPSYNPDRMFEGWLISIVQNCLVDFMKNHRREWLAVDDPDINLDYPSEPEEYLWVRHKLEALASTGTPEGEFVRLHYLLDLPWKDVAVITGLSNRDISRIKKRITET